MYAPVARTPPATRASCLPAATRRSHTLKRALPRLGPGDAGVGVPTGRGHDFAARRWWSALCARDAARSRLCRAIGCGRPGVSERGAGRLAPPGGVCSKAQDDEVDPYASWPRRLSRFNPNRHQKRTDETVPPAPGNDGCASPVVRGGGGWRWRSVSSHRRAVLCGKRKEMPRKNPHRRLTLENSASANRPRPCGFENEVRARGRRRASSRSRLPNRTWTRTECGRRRRRTTPVLFVGPRGRGMGRPKEWTPWRRRPRRAV